MIDIGIEIWWFLMFLWQKVVEKDFSEDDDDCSVDGESINEEQSKKRRRQWDVCGVRNKILMDPK